MKNYNFSVERLRLNRIYESESVEFFENTVFESEKIRDIYGKLLFPNMPELRPYTYSSFVSSIDGKVGFSESPDGSLVAKSNSYDPDGGLCDFWILNMLRSVSDAIVMGGGAIREESYLRGVIFDNDLFKDRIDSGRPPVPLNIVVTGSGSIPLNHRVVLSEDIPLLIVTTSSGRKKLLKELTGNCNDYGCFTGMGEIDDFDKTAPLGLIAVGEGDIIDASLLLVLLKKVGINMLLVESPSFTVSLMREKLLDEIFLNISSVFIGGNSPSIGRGMKSFEIGNHPHAQILTIHSHSDYFVYFRYKIHYG